MKYEIPTINNMDNVNRNNPIAIAEIVGKLYSVSILFFTKTYLVNSFNKSHDFHKFFETIEV